MNNAITTNVTQSKRLTLQHTLFLLPLLFPVIGSILGLYFDSLVIYTWFTPVFILGILPILDAYIGEASTNSPEQFEPHFKNNMLSRILPTLTLPGWLALAFWGMSIIDALSIFHWIGWMLSLGLVAGICLINVSHELVHRNTSFERIVGGLLLASVWNLAFKIEHVKGHHREVATKQDHSSASFGENVYSFIPKAMRGNITRAWSLEQQRLQAQSKPWYYNEMLPFACFSLAVTLVVSIAYGLPGLIFYAALSFFTNCLLEIINYIEHYGLLRESNNGKFEPVGLDHAWNSNYWLSNAFLLNLQRHSDHHMHAGRPYTALRHYDNSPQLPFGYAAMITIALIPPLWKRTMDPLVLKLRNQQHLNKSSPTL